MPQHNLDAPNMRTKHRQLYDMVSQNKISEINLDHHIHHTRTTSNLSAMFSRNASPSFVNFLPAALSISVPNSAISFANDLLSCAFAIDARRTFSRLRRSCATSSAGRSVG